MKDLEEIKLEDNICNLLVIKRTKKQSEECYRLILEYQVKYRRAFPISVLDRYLNELDETQQTTSKSFDRRRWAST